MAGEDEYMERNCDACARIVALAKRQGAQHSDPRAFLMAFGRQGAGIRGGVLGVWDLARGGRDVLSGGGFNGEFDDGSGGQARHFCGIIVSACWFGRRLTRFVSVLIRRDRHDSADGRLSDAALDFVRLVRAGEVSVDAAHVWIAAQLCKG
ncbi:hypothetical protein [Mycolicibacterium baixiangningiae]|uniref:hypothetical protein n=1 Tax=Mycolicibacterium baixiangningiae TaxID=2761578 RepID=UPI001867C5D3|nr:hypothetical protein [Mycolicibacterium baixiangningiae]